jgi:hypothetical protein
MNEQSSDKANRWLEDHTPPGWTRRLVPLPSVRGCRACGRVDTTTKYKVGLVYLHRAPELLYAFATLCGPCFDDADVKAALVKKVFVTHPLGERSGRAEGRTT